MLLVSYTSNQKHVLLFSCALTYIFLRGMMIIVFRERSFCLDNKSGTVGNDTPYEGVQDDMPIAVEFVSTRRKKIAVDVVPATWQLYIAH